MVCDLWSVVCGLWSVVCGGLAAACRLAALGYDITLVERNAAVGGKVNRVEKNGFSFDTGASLVTMKHVFEELFTDCGRDINDYIDFVELDPVCRYRWSDGTQFDAASGIEPAIQEIKTVFPGEESAFERFVSDSRSKYEIAERTFLAKSLNELPQLLKPSYLPDLFRISSLNTLHKHNSRYFKSTKLQQLFDRYATYNGSSPYRTPATFALIPWVEFGLGAWYPRGGIYTIPRALRRLAEGLGVVFRFGSSVSEIVVRDGEAAGVVLDDGTSIETDVVVCNADAVSAYRELIPAAVRRIYSEKKLAKIEPSCSGFVLLLGTDRKFDGLSHHNIFFSDDYEAEFESIFTKKTPAESPTVYVCATSRTDPTQAPEGCENLFVLVNAPYTSDAVEWGVQSEGVRESGSLASRYGDMIIDRLESFGLEGLRDSIVYRETITPEDFESRYRANRGSIYGVSSNGILSAFMRVPNMAKDIKRLYFVGGTTHPGGGMPLVLLSAKMTAELIKLRSEGK